MAVLALCLCNSAHPGSRELADGVKAIIEMNDPESWPEHCRAYRGELLDDESASAPQTVEPQARDREEMMFRVLVWNGIGIPVPEAQFDKMVLIPESLSALRSEQATVLFSRLDLTPHFLEHFGGIEEFAAYSERGRNLVEWIEDGLALRASDIECRPQSMIHDMIHIVHQLVTELTALADDQTWMMRVKGAQSALVLGKNFGGQEKPIRIQYIFQHPSATNIEMFTVTYHLAPSVDVVQAMSEFVTAIEKGGDSPDIAADGIVQALLEGNHERASSLAQSIGLEVQQGLR